MTGARALDHAARMGREAAEFFEEFGLPQRNPFGHGHSPIEKELARAWARGYSDALGVGRPS